MEAVERFKSELNVNLECPLWIPPFITPHYIVSLNVITPHQFTIRHPIPHQFTIRHHPTSIHHTSSPHINSPYVIPSHINSPYVITPHQFTIRHPIPHQLTIRHPIPHQFTIRHPISHQFTLSQFLLATSPHTTLI